MLQIIKKQSLALGALLALPLISFAQFGGRTELTDFGGRIINFINQTLVPAAFAVVLGLFVYGIFRLYVWNPDKEEDRKKAREYVLWAVIALVVIVSVWGIANLIARGLGFDDPDAIDGLIPEAGQLRR